MTKPATSLVPITPVEAIPAVAAFMEVAARYEEFVEKNPAFFRYLAALTEEYNEKLAHAEATVREKKTTCGPFVLYQYATKHNPDAMFDTLGRERFMAVGGTIARKEVRGIDKKALKVSINARTITAEEAAAFTTVTAKYKKPEAL